MVKISIIIPVYNAEKYIEQCLRSIIMQSFTDYEVICVNDGSTDGSREILGRYAEKYPGKFQIYDQENKGQSAARNYAFDHAGGEYIAYVDADDYILPDYLEKLHQRAREKHAELVICSYKKFLNDGTIVMERSSKDWMVKFGGYCHVFQYSPCAKLIKTSFLQKYDIRFYEGEKMEDGPYGILTNCLARHIEVMDYFGYMYRKYDESTMGGIRQDGVSVNIQELKLPMRGFEEAVIKILENCSGEGYREVMEYAALKALAGYIYVFSRGEGQNKENLKQICGFVQRMIKMYFPLINKNPYIRLRKPEGLPFMHRAAVVAMKWTYDLHILYPFARLYTGI